MGAPDPASVLWFIVIMSLIGVALHFYDRGGGE